MHYSIKLDATELLLDNLDNTFVTPVFNGSASLRSAAGQLVEEVTKTMRRKKPMGEGYMDNLFADTTSLYRLNQIGVSTGEASLGALPPASIALLVALAICWLGIGFFFVCNYKKSKKSVKKD